MAVLVVAGVVRGRKGASEGRVLMRHVLPNAWIPIITNNVTSIPFLILGSFLMERFFSIPGIGSLLIDAILRNDTPVIMAVTFVLNALWTWRDRGADSPLRRSIGIPPGFQVDLDDLHRAP